MTGGLLQVTLLVTVSCYLMVIVSGNCVTRNGLSGLFQHSGRNAIFCNKSEEHLNKEEEFVVKKGPYFTACYKLSFSKKNNQINCSIKKKGKLKRIKLLYQFKDQNGMDYKQYSVQTPKNGDGKYKKNQLCTYHFPPPQWDHAYTYLFLQPPSIEQSTNNNLRCLDSLQFEHTLDVSTASRNIPILTCGDEIDNCIDGQIVISNIKITFRSNEKVQKSGADFLVSEYFVGGHAITGPPGDEGMPGVVGRGGRPGVEGDRGDPGPQGNVGDDGDPGSKGDSGESGQPGSPGNSGPRGSPGPKAERGRPGPPGKACSCHAGKPGIPGKPGPQPGPQPGPRCCSPGETGDKGDNGLPGHPGQRGRQGNQGRPGVNGKHGETGLPGNVGQVGAPGEVGDRGHKGFQGVRGPPGPPGESHCPGITERDIRHVRSLLSNLDASDVVDQGYFDAWRGHHQISKSGGFILRQYVHDDNQELSQNTDNFTEETFNRRQFNIRRGPVLSVWTTDRKQNGIKFEEHDENIVASEDSHSKRSTSGQSSSIPTESSYCPKGYTGLPGVVGLPGMHGPKGRKGNTGYRGPKGFQGRKGEHGSKGSPGDPGAPSLPGPRGSPGLKGRKGQPGLPGLPGQCKNRQVSGVPGIPGTRGRRQSHRIQSCSRLKGQKGDHGEQGLRGYKGRAGPLGPPGLPGASGQKGQKGNPGAKGSKGQKGKSGKRGRNGKPGLSGPPGPPGCVCEMKVILDKFNFITPAKRRQKQKIIDSTAYHKFPGPPGPFKNSYCVQGAPGVRGDNGSPGRPGYRGLRGHPGTVGPKGPQGLLGNHGSKGDKGQTISSGPPGSPGPIGNKGSPGDRGPTGPPGTSVDCRSTRSYRAAPPNSCPPEIKGAKGTKGVRGHRGSPGIIGPRGPRGIPGQRGRRGSNGKKGLPGLPGRNGHTGPTGYDGDPGLPGLPGPIGSKEGCPEFDGIDLTLLKPNPAELVAIKRLITKRESDYACSLRDASQPLLQQLAFHYCKSN